MKHILLTLTSILLSLGAYGGISRSVTFNRSENNVNPQTKESHKPLVVEGRTWWYESSSQIDGPIDYGVTIGKEVVINDVKWNEIRVIKSMLHGFDGVWHDCKDEDAVVGYIREDGTKVYSKPFIKHSFKPINELCFWHDMYEDNEVLVYDYGTSASHFFFGFRESNMLKIGYEITETSDIINSGINYKKWTAIYDGVYYWEDNDLRVIEPEKKPFEYVEGIGVTRPSDFSMLFYFPWEGALNGDWDYRMPILRYVTEGEDNTIIYEGIGGQKLWTIPASVDNIAADTTDSNIEWYTIQGLKIDRPTTPGVYIRRQDGTATKVVVK